MITEKTLKPIKTRIMERMRQIRLMTMSIMLMISSYLQMIKSKTKMQSEEP